MKPAIDASHSPSIPKMRDPGLITRGLLLALLAQVVAGCAAAPDDAAPVAIDTAVVFSEPLVVVPGMRWKEHGRGRWSFHNRASLVSWVRAAQSGEPLVVSLRPNRFTREHHFTVEWDGAPLTAAAVRSENGELTIAVPPELLAPGYHELTLDRDYLADAKAHRKQTRNVFVEIRYRHGSHEESLATEEMPRYQLLARFLQFRVLGTGKEQRGGVLFAGPARHDLALPARGSLRLEPHNLSQRPALFRVAGEGGTSVTVAPGERADLRVELSGGELALEVEGDPRGFYLWGMPRVEAAASAEHPPIVLITLDTTRRDALGLFNGLAEATPNLDRLAREATVYEHAYSTAPWTLPAHASIFTGLYPSRHGAGVSRPDLGEVATLAGLLSGRGYLTAGFSSGELSSSRFGLARGFHYYRDPDQFETPGERLAGYLDAFLDDYGDQGRLFLFVNYFDPHALYQAPAAFEEKFRVPRLREKMRGQPVWDELIAGKMAAWRSLVEGQGEITQQGVVYLRSAYLAEVAYTDHLVGRLFARLRELGIYDRALIVVTADHGELLGEGGYVSHGARLDPELVEIPLLIKWPGQREGRRDRRLTSLVDLFPTILHAAGVAPPPNDGLPLFPGPDGAPPHPFVLLEEHVSVVHPLPENMKIASHLFGVQRPGFRQLVWGNGQTCARRNGRGWRGERCTTDRGDVLAAIRAQLGTVETDNADAVVTDDVRESLKALGYM